MAYAMTHTQLQEPQSKISQFWENFQSSNPGLVCAILDPSGPLCHRDPNVEEGNPLDHESANSYEAARSACIKQVTDIVKQCNRNNEMFTDPDFDIAGDFFRSKENRECLYGLPTPKGPHETPPQDNNGWGQGWSSPHDQRGEDHQSRPSQGQPTRAGDKVFSRDGPEAVHRVHEIFENPSFAPKAPKRYLPHSVRATSQLSLAASIWTIKGLLVAASLLVGLLLLDLLSFGRTVMFHPAAGLMLLSATVARAIHNRSAGPNFVNSEIKQGGVGDCWWLSAVAALCSRNDLISRLCVAWDQECGVYGFVFYRDGSWIYTVVDDYLYLQLKDYIESDLVGISGDLFDERANLHKKAHQTGALALFFAKGGKKDYTWLPLLEKAYAKVHGDFESLDGGCLSEGLEDLTGGVISVVRTDNIKNRDRLWKELQNISSDFLIGLSSPSKGDASQSRGLTPGHAFAVEKAQTVFHLDGWKVKRVRLLKIRNPWGLQDGLWHGDWGVGSDKWDPFSTWWLQPECNQPGTFFMTFEEVLTTFRRIERTSFFDDQKWTCKQEWAKLDVSWMPQYSPVYFEVHLAKESNVTFALSQLGNRYFTALRGRHVFHLEFLVKEKGKEEGENLARAAANNQYRMQPWRSVHLEQRLEPGVYEVLVKITALNRTDEDSVWSAEDVVMQSLNRPKKLQQVARNYDAAHKKLKDVTPNHWGKRRSNSFNNQAMHYAAETVAWNAVCGVGLRVFSKDPDMHIELHHRDEGKVNGQIAESKYACSNRSNGGRGATGWSDDGWGSKTDLNNGGGGNWGTLPKVDSVIGDQNQFDINSWNAEVENGGGDYWVVGDPGGLLDDGEEKCHPDGDDEVEKLVERKLGIPTSNFEAEAQEDPLSGMDNDPVVERKLGFQAWKDST